MEEAQRSQLPLCCGSLGSVLSSGDTGQERSVPKQNKDWVEMGTAAPCCGFILLDYKSPGSGYPVPDWGSLTAYVGSSLSEQASFLRICLCFPHFPLFPATAPWLSLCLVKL